MRMHLQPGVPCFSCVSTCTCTMDLGIQCRFCLQEMRQAADEVSIAQLICADEPDVTLKLHERNVCVCV